MKLSIHEGLLKLDSLDIPHPEWEFAKQPHELRKYYRIPDTCGWTIRSLLEADAHPQGRPFHVNRVYKPTVPDKVKQFQQILRGQGQFVVYPSWKWALGGRMLVDRDKIIIEAVQGSVVKLTRAGRRDLTLIHDRESKQTIHSDGNKELIPSAVKTAMFNTADKLKDDNYILSWACTLDNKFYFYTLETLEDAQKRVLAKYQK